MAVLSLPPAVEARIRTQLEIWRRQASDLEEKPGDAIQPFVTISRQYGCDAFSLAESLAEKLKKPFGNQAITIYDRELLNVISEKKEITEYLVHSLTERTRGEIEDWMVSLFGGLASEMKAFRSMAKTIIALASKGHCIIVGRGGAVITQNLDGGRHVRLVAPIEWRLKNLEQYSSHQDDLQLEQLKQLDIEREGFVKKYLEKDIKETGHFDVILNNEKLSLEEQVNIVATLFN